MEGRSREGDRRGGSETCSQLPQKYMCSPRDTHSGWLHCGCVVLIRFTAARSARSQGPADHGPPLFVAASLPPCSKVYSTHPPMTLYRCTCHLARRTVVGAHHHRAQRHASTSLPSAGAGAAAALEEKLVRLARQTLSKAATATAAGAGASDPSTEGHSVNDVEAAKRTKQLEGLRDALREWQETHDVGPALRFPITLIFFLTSGGQEGRSMLVSTVNLF